MNLGETITIAWCDNGLTDGQFTDSLVGILLQCNQLNIPILNAVRVQGNQIGRQRQVVFDAWADQIKTDWILWIDSDISVQASSIKTLVDSADSKKYPVLSGVYFIVKEIINGVPQPLPAIFDEVDEYTIQYHHPLPINEIIKIDCAGMGLVMMHKSIIEKLRKNNEDGLVFGEKEAVGNKYISEDIVFFRKLKDAGIQAYANTGVLSEHIKRFPLNISYYNFYWNNFEE